MRVLVTHAKEIRLYPKVVTKISCRDVPHSFRRTCIVTLWRPDRRHGNQVRRLMQRSRYKVKRI